LTAFLIEVIKKSKQICDTSSEQYEADCKIFLPSLLLLATLAMARTYPTRVYTTLDGLSGRSVSDLLITRESDYLVGTYQGVAHFLPEGDRSSSATGSSDGSSAQAFDQTSPARHGRCQSSPYSVLQKHAKKSSPDRQALSRV
jgi:hypothetical protein